MVLRLRSCFLCLAAAVLCALSLGSHTAYAQISVDDFEDNEIELRHTVLYAEADANSPTFSNHGIIADTGWLAGNTSSYIKYGTYGYSSSGNHSTLNFIDRFNVRNNEEPLVEKGCSLDLTVTGLAGHTLWGYGSSSDNGGELVPYKSYKPIKFQLFAFDVSGNYVLLDNGFEINYYPTGSRGYNLEIDTGVVPFNVYRFEVDVVWSYGGFYNASINDYKSGNYSFNRGAGFINCGMSWYFKFENEAVVEESLQVQKGILETILELPSNLWSAFEDGLTGLFVPDDDSIAAIQEDWNGLLADRFGALYQVGDLISDYAAAFQDSNQRTITLPEISVPIAGSTWTFGGWEVVVVPEGMEVLFTFLKTIVSICATILFVNGLKRRFEGLIGGAPTA